MTEEPGAGVAEAENAGVEGVRAIGEDATALR
jgi:hypothetical protein